MDDLILVGAFSIILLYAAAAITAGAVAAVLWEFSGAVIAGNTGRIAAILALVLVFLAAYTGTGRWLQKTGRI